MKAATLYANNGILWLLFQSTPPVKAATVIRRHETGGQNISIHAAREGGDRGIPVIYAPKIISIHAAREGGDGGNV